MYYILGATYLHLIWHILNITFQNRGSKSIEIDLHFARRTAIPDAKHNDVIDEFIFGQNQSYV